MNRQELNKAIWKVLNSKFKKDAKEAFKMVEDAGYEVYKDGWGYWVVANRENHRFIHLQDNRYRTIIQHGPYVTHTHRCTEKETYAIEITFDFVGCLEKPVNQTWYDLRNGRKNKLTAVDKYNEIKFQKRMAESYAEDIEKTKKQIEKLQAELVRQATCKAQYEAKVQASKVKFGLA